VIGNAYDILVGKPEGKRPLGKLNHSWEVNVKAHLKDIACEGVDGISLAENANTNQFNPNLSSPS
jgi:hypothetical protein